MNEIVFDSEKKKKKKQRVVSPYFQESESQKSEIEHENKQKKKNKKRASKVSPFFEQIESKVVKDKHDHVAKTKTKKKKKRVVSPYFGHVETNISNHDQVDNDSIFLYDNLVTQKK